MKRSAWSIGMGAVVAASYVLGCNPETRVIYQGADAAAGTSPQIPGLPPGATAPPGTAGTTPPTAVPNGGGGTNCAVETHSVLRYENRLLETFTSSGKLFTFELNGAAWPGNGSDLATVNHYATGPCAGMPQGACRLETRAFVNVSGQVLEYITAGGKNWTFDDGVATDRGSDLASNARYKEACAGRGTGVCTFDTRTFLFDQNRYVESITAYGRIFELTFASQGGGEYPTTRNGQDLTNIPHYASGPCLGRAGGQCKLDTRTYLELNGEVTEVIVAYGKIWRFVDGRPLEGNGAPAHTMSPWNQGMCR